MKHQLSILFLSLLLLVAGTFSVSAQIVDAGGQYVDTVFNDHVDRTAEDFVIASLIVSDPGTILYSVLGHACIRLQCPMYNMDYCFSYEGESENEKILSFFAGKLMMGLLAIPTEKYCAGYEKIGRGVYEYILNLPIDVKRELWRVMDEHVAEGIYLPYDYYHRGCAITVKDFVKEALGETVIVYDRSLYEKSQSVKEIWNKHTKNALWVRFLCYFIGAGFEIEKPLLGDKQLIVPADLVHAWQHAKVNGEPLLAGEPIVLVEGEPKYADVWFSPMMLAVLLLLFAIANLFWRHPYFDWLMLAVQTLIGCFITYLICFSDLCCTGWNWLIIPFNPLLAICWHWRKCWALPYAGVLVIWSLSMAASTIFGHVLVDWNHIVMVLAWMIIIIKQSKLIRIYNNPQVQM